MRLRLLLCAALVCFGFGTVSAAEPEKFELKDGDRVVFLGNTLIEREQKYGYWELMLTMAWSERNVTFRNLGWSGDTVWGESRAGFGTQADGFKKLVEEVNAARPTVIFVGYGNVEAFDGEKGLPKFVDGFGKLLDELEKTKAQIVVLGPLPQVRSDYQARKFEEQNRNIKLYRDASASVAEERKHLFVELQRKPEHPKSLSMPNTVDGSDVTGVGYLNLAISLAQQLQLADRPEVAIVLGVRTTSTGWNLIQAIQKKNELFFHRWRPQNETYLFGFRKHEQGKNAVEVFQFDPLVEAEEKKIAELRVKLAAEMKAAEKNGGVK